MDTQRAKQLIHQERDRISGLLQDSTSAGQSDRQAASEPARPPPITWMGPRPEKDFVMRG